MKRFIPVLALCLALVCACAAAEVKLPTFSSYSKNTAKLTAFTENPQTATNQYDTDETAVHAYIELLGHNGFVMNGQWELPGGEGYERLTVRAYTYMGNERLNLFDMNVGEDSVRANLVLQTARLEGGKTVVAITRSADIPLYEYEWATPTPKPTPRPTPRVTYEPDPEPSGNVCRYCDHGKCRECHGRGKVPCSWCEGARLCPICNGIGSWYVSGYGVGQGSTVYCSSCGGSKLCEKCGGSGSEKCAYCDNGVCRACHGDYMNP